MIDILESAKCPYCENEINVNCRKYIAGSTSSEKDMGTDMQLIIESEPMCCPNCNREIMLTGTVGIYPEDIIEFVDIKFKEV